MLMFLLSRAPELLFGSVESCCPGFSGRSYWYERAKLVRWYWPGRENHLNVPVIAAMLRLLRRIRATGVNITQTLAQKKPERIGFNRLYLDGVGNGIILRNSGVRRRTHYCWLAHLPSFLHRRRQWRNPASSLISGDIWLHWVRLLRQHNRKKSSGHVTFSSPAASWSMRPNPWRFLLATGMHLDIIAKKMELRVSFFFPSASIYMKGWIDTFGDDNHHYISSSWKKAKHNSSIAELCRLSGSKRRRCGARNKDIMHQRFVYNTDT